MSDLKRDVCSEPVWLDYDCQGLPHIDRCLWPRSNIAMEASSITYVISGANIAPFLVLTRGSKPRVKEAEHFAQQLEACGTDVELLEVKGMNHREINRAIGEAGEKVVTPVVRDFINGLKY